MLKLCALALLAAILLLPLREAGGRLGGVAAALCGVLLLLTLTERYATIFSFLDTLGENAVPGEAVSLSLRALGLSFLTEVTAGICRDLGEGGLATRLEWCGRAEILVLALPTLVRLLELAVSYLG